MKWTERRGPDTYNGDGLLQSRTTGGSTVNLLWDPNTSPSRLLKSGSDAIVYGLGPLYSVNGSTVTTYARDGQKSIRAELNGSTVNGSWRYRAYGDIVQSGGSSTPSILGYAGQLRDPSGLYYMRARWYDATEQRFLTRDQQSGSPTSPLTLNAFGYAGLNPVLLRDPSGYCPFSLQCLAWWGVAMVVGADEADAAVDAAYSSNPVDFITGRAELAAGLVFDVAGAVAVVGMGYDAIRARVLVDQEASVAEEASSDIWASERKLSSQLQQHGADFGVSESNTAANRQQFLSALRAHQSAANTVRIEGTYRGEPAIHWVDPSSGLNVTTTLDNELLGAWQLSPAQLNYVLTKGSLN